MSSTICPKCGTGRITGIDHSCVDGENLSQAQKWMRRYLKAQDKLNQIRTQIQSLADVHKINGEWYPVEMSDQLEKLERLVKEK